MLAIGSATKIMVVISNLSTSLLGGREAAMGLAVEGQPSAASVFGHLLSFTTFFGFRLP
jgi:hypothetical protein